MSVRTLTAAAFAAALWLGLPVDAHAQNVVASFQAQYTWFIPYPDPYNPIVAGPYRVRFTLYDDNTWVNDDGNGGEYNLDTASGDITLWFFSQAEATATYPPFGAATWEGRLNGRQVCNGSATSPGTDPFTGYPVTVRGVWSTRGCP